MSTLESRYDSIMLLGQKLESSLESVSECSQMFASRDMCFVPYSYYLASAELSVYDNHYVIGVHCCGTPMVESAACLEGTIMLSDGAFCRQ